jgi:hypothetical protein
MSLVDLTEGSLDGLTIALSRDGWERGCCEISQFSPRMPSLNLCASAHQFCELVVVDLTGIVKILSIA